jgi:hypothetical protein
MYVTQNIMYIALSFVTYLTRWTLWPPVGSFKLIYFIFNADYHVVVIFVYLFNGAFSNTDFMYGFEIVRLLINIELETKFTEATVA